MPFVLTELEFPNLRPRGAEPSQTVSSDPLNHDVPDDANMLSGNAHRAAGARVNDGLVVGAEKHARVLCSTARWSQSKYL